MDGTFEIRPRRWAQIYAVHFFYEGSFIPAAAIIMASKSGSYEHMLGRLKEAVFERFHRTLCPRIIITDFELSIRKALRVVFPGTSVLFERKHNPRPLLGAEHKACIFHFIRSNLRRITSLGLKRLYGEDVDYNEFIKCFLYLPFVPPQHVETAFSAWVDESSKNGAMIIRGRTREFIDYYRKVRYLNHSTVPKIQY